MKKIKKKIFTILILIVLLLNVSFPIAMAINKDVSNVVEENYEELENNTVEKNNDVKDLVYQNIVDTNLSTECVETEVPTNYYGSNFDVLLATILNNNSSTEYSNVNEIVATSEITDYKGVWVSTDDRDYVLNFINKISNNIYKYNEYGFLIKDCEKLGNDIRESYSYYTDKIEEIINSNKLIVISIDSQYKTLNGNNDGLLDVFIEENDFSLLFKNEDETKEVVLLNSSKYNPNNEFESLATLMNHFLELYYYNDDDFIEYIQDKTNNIQLFSLNSLEMKDNNNTEEQYNVALAGILNEEITNIAEMDDVIEYKPNGCGMWITENSREYVLDLINLNTQMSYGVNEDGYLTILNNNGIEEKNYNNTEKSLREIINGDKLVIIDLKDYYMERIDSSNNIMKFLLEKSEYKKVFTTANSKIILMNSMMFNENNTEDDEKILISYILEEFLYNFEQDYEITNNGISLAYSGSIKGNMNSAQNVYAGPSNENYAKVGSVSSGEEITVLEGEFGWYQIEYETSSGNKVGFVPKNSVPNVNMNDTTVPYDNGGLAFAHSKNIDVYYGYPTTDYVKVGTIYKGEGITFLQKINDLAYIEYASSTGTKRGLVKYSDIFVVEKSSVARINSTSSAYAGPDNDFVKLGGAYYNEYVVVLEKMEDWCFVEYNTITGRKCGYMSAGKLDIFKSINFYDFATYNGLKKATEQLTVFGGPDSNYASLGTVFNQEVLSYLRNIERNDKLWAYIEYNTTNGAKRGYVDYSKLVDTQAPLIPTIPTYSNFSKGSYYPNITANGNDLEYYSIGSGDNTVFLVFEQHGWEDAWASDGVELVNIANNVMNDLSTFYLENQNVFNYWKVIVIPYANPDGITHGYSNNGPGRCTVENYRKIDMNRSWPANFTPYYTSRNYTGAYSLGRKDEQDYGAGEIRGLKDFIDNNLGVNNIIIDTHGWLNLTYGDLELGRYFSKYFGFANNGSYGSGYLIKYGESVGAKSCLVELPKPSNSSSIVSENYASKFAASVKDMLVGEMQEVLGGEDVNEVCKIYSTGNVNVRELPNTNSNIVESISNGTIVTRIKKNVTTSNGYVWDKIRLSDGREGYIATNFLQIVPNNDIIYELNDSDEAIQVLKAYLRYNGINNYDDTPTALLDESAMETIKVYQSLNNLTQTGNFDRNTIEKMGFSLDATNKIIQNDYYNTYLQYAINYINYGNPTQVTYVEIPVFLDDLQKYNRFVYDRAYTSTSPYTLTTIEEMDAKYNQMPDDEKDQKAGDLTATVNKFNLMANNPIAGIFWENAKASLNRYIDNTGETLYHTNIAEQIEDNEAHYNVYKDYVKRAADAAEKFVPEGNRDYTFSLEYEASAAFGSSNKNLWASIGKYRIEMVCTVSKVNDTYNMSVEYKIKDYYDWIENSTEVFDFGITSVVEHDGFLLHYAGRAKTFHQEGDAIIKNYSWQKGNSQTIV